MIIGTSPTPQVNPVHTPDDQATLIEVAAERACSRPHLRNLKGRALYRECLTVARAQALAQFEQRTASAQLAAR